MTMKLPSVAILLTPEYRYLQLQLASRLKSAYGSTIHFYVQTPQQADFLRKNANGCADSVQVANFLNRAGAAKIDETATFAAARHHEARLGVTYNSLLVSQRHFGRGFALGGLHHPRSRMSEETPYVNVVAAYNWHFDFWRAEHEQKGISLMLGGATEHAVVAQHIGFPWRTIAGSRYKNYHYWARNRFFESSEFGRRFEAVDGPGEEADLAQPYKLELTLRPRYARDASIAGVAKQLGRMTLQRTYWKVRGYAKGRSYYMRDELAYVWRRWRSWREMTGRRMRRLSDLSGKRFVFYPLQTEPEASLGASSPEYFYQLPAIAALSRDLPAGVFLAVKETIHGVGPRPKDFYRQIAEFKNVIMLDMLEYGLDVVRAADATATISGSPGFEAAVLGKPVISFGHHNEYRILPHVFTVTDETQLRAYLQKIFEGGVDHERARCNGARYLRAVVESSFDLGRYDYVDLKNFGGAEVDRAYEALIASLR